MALVVVVIRDQPGRFHGFLSSTMLEVAPNIFVSPRMSPRVRTRIWGVLSDWYHYDPQGSIVMVWRDLNAVGGIGVSNLGEPPRELVEADGMWLVRRSVPKNKGNM
ncbi:MAG: type I-E CRISPR-associated endoribonuclease Cas2e [Castellaniella sp.]